MSTNFKLTLCDLNLSLVNEWAKVFSNTNVTISSDTILNTRGDALVSPANSFGFMNGGIDGVYTKAIGRHLQTRVQNEIINNYDGELLIGQALVVPTDDTRWTWLISAPTMRTPAVIPDLFVYLSTRAALRIAFKNNWSVVMPGMGTLTGNVPPDLAAKAMYKAYEHVVINPLPYPKSLMEAFQVLER